MPDKSMRARRPAARILLMDNQSKLLLFRFTPADRAPFWCTPGGAVDAGESFEDAARRELWEETGLVADPGPQIADRQVEFISLEGIPVIADERYFCIRLDTHSDHFLIDTTAHTALENEVMREWRWFSIGELACLNEPYFPIDLIDMVQDLAK